MLLLELPEAIDSELCLAHHAAKWLLTLLLLLHHLLLLLLGNQVLLGLL